MLTSGFGLKVMVEDSLCASYAYRMNISCGT